MSYGGNWPFFSEICGLLHRREFMSDTMNSIKTHEWVSLRPKVATYYSCSVKVTWCQITFQIFMYYMYTHTHTHNLHPVKIREVPLYNEWQWMQWPMASQSAENSDGRFLILTRTLMPSILKLREHCGRGGRRGIKSQRTWRRAIECYLPGIRWPLQSRSLSRCTCLHWLCRRLDQWIWEGFTGP